MSDIQRRPSTIAAPREPAFTALQLAARRIVSHDMPDPRPADAFRDLRTQLLARVGERSAAILVAAAQRASGGSFVALNLAAAVAFDESRTSVLIDCDLRAPRQHLNLGIDPTRGGLVDFLEGRIDEIGTIAYATGVPRLLLVPAGSRREASGDLLGSRRMRMLLDSLRGIDPRRTIVLDAPAISSAPDARILAKQADLTVLVAGYGRDSAAAVREAAAVVPPDRFAGVVFNRVP